MSVKTENTLSFFTIGDTPYNSLTFTTNESGLFTFRVTANSAIGKQSAPAEATITVSGLSAAPADVSNFSMIPVNGQARLTWDRAADLDVRVGGHVLIRHSPLTSGVTWANSTTIAKEISGSSTEAYVDLKEGTYLIKFVDSGGRQSLAASLIEFLKPDLLNLHNERTITEHPNFSGTKTDLTVNTLNELELLLPIFNLLLEDGDKLLLEDGTSELLQESDRATSGTYLFAGNPIQFSGVTNVSLDSTVKVRGYRPTDTRLDEVADFDSILDFEGSVPQDAECELYIRTTQDDPNNSPTYTSWRKFNNAEFKARAFEVKAEVTTTSNRDQVGIQELEVRANLPVYSQTGTKTTSSSADVSVTYSNSFYLTPQVGIAFTTQSSGDYYVINNSSATGFDISVYNSSGTPQVRQISWTATGYGKG